MLGTDKPKDAASEDDPEVDAWGEKLRRSELKELRELKARRKEMDAAAHKRFQEAAEARKEIARKEAEFLRVANAIKEDPFAIHKHQGLSDEQLDAIAEQRLIAQMKRAQMTPEQIEAESTKSELEQLREWKATQEKTQKEAAHTALKAKYVQHYDQQIAQALTSANLARTRRTAAQVAGVMAEYMEAGEQIDPALAGAIVRDQMHTEVRHELSELLTSNPQEALALIGPELVALIQKNAVTEAKQFQPQQRQSAAPKQQTAPKPKTPPTFEEVRKQLGIRGY
jgi:uncharacterized Zn finger protein